jgi:hypothetical protein
MKRLSAKLEVIQNMGWLDRVLRAVAGAALLAFAMTAMMASNENLTWALYAVLASVYPLLTAIVGWDPIYEMMTVRTCGMSDRNPCGTFPFEVDAALGHRPIPRSDIEHSLENSRH